MHQLPHHSETPATPTSAPQTASDSDFDAEFFTLLSQWNRHQELRSSAPSISSLARSRADLDQQRLATYRLAS